MRTALEQAGAERGLLILARDNEPRIKAEASSDRDKVTIHVRQSSVPARHASALANGGESPAELPESLLRYVIRTRESVTLHEPADQVDNRLHRVRQESHRTGNPPGDGLEADRKNSCCNREPSKTG